MSSNSNSFSSPGSMTGRSRHSSYFTGQDTEEGRGLSCPSSQEARMEPRPEPRTQVLRLQTLCYQPPCCVHRKTYAYMCLYIYVCILSPCLFNFYAGYNMRNAGLEEAQARIKIAGRTINHLRYADDTTLMAESEEELKSLLMKVESGKVGLKLNIQKTNIMASGPITSWGNRWGNSGNSVRLYLFGLQNHCRWRLQP